MRKPILVLKRQQRRNIKRLSRQNRHAFVQSRCKVLLAMIACTTVAEAARQASVARSMANRTRSRYLEGGLEAIRTVEAGRKPYKVSPSMHGRLIELIGENPSTYGWSRSRWSSELLSLQLAKETGAKIHASHIRRLLAKSGIVYRRPAPYIRRLDPNKVAKLTRIGDIINHLDDSTVAIYEDEVDIHLLPKMGPVWTPRGVQPQVGTPGQNAKRYLAGGVNIKTGDVHWLESDHKNSALFFDFLFLLPSLYPGATRIYVIVDNYIIHKSKILAKMMRKAGLSEVIEVVFLPTYSPKYNPVERLWKCLHDTVTRNHDHVVMETLMAAVHAFMLDASPFPGARHSTGRFDSVLKSVLDLGSGI